MAVSVQQAVVHAPGVDAEGIQVPEAPLPEGQQPLLELVVQIGRVPVEDAVHLDVVVFKAVQLPHCQSFSVELAQDGPAIAGAQVKGNHIPHVFLLLHTKRERFRAFRRRGGLTLYYIRLLYNNQEISLNYLY